MYREDAIREALLELEHSKRAAKQNPDDTQCQMDLGASYHALAKQYESQRHWIEALRCHQASLEILKRLADQNPSDGYRHIALMSGYRSLGSLYRDLKHWDAALRCYTSAREIRDRFVNQWPHEVGLQIGFSSALSQHRFQQPALRP